MAKDVRKITNDVISAVEDGFLSWETVAKAALKYMSEDDVADMAQINDWALFPDEDQEICPECGEELGEDGRCYNPDCDQYDPLSQYFDDDEDEGDVLDESQIQISRGSREFDNVIKTYYKKYGKHLQVDTMIYDKDSGKYYMYNDQTDYTLTTKRLNESLEEAAGGNALGMTVEDIAKKHGVAVDDIEKQIKIGIEIEQEHTSDEEQAKKIAMDHLVEFPDYYDRLVKMEKEAEAELDAATDELESLEEAFDIDAAKKKAEQYVKEKGFGYDYAVDNREVARAINFMTLLYATEEALETDVWFNQYNISDGFATLASPGSFTSKHNEKQLSLWKENKVKLQKLAKQLNGNIELITLSNGDKQVVLDVDYSKGEEKELREESFSETDLEEALNYDKLNFRGLTGEHELEYEDVPVLNQFDEDMEIDYTLDIEISQEMVIDFICEYYILARDILTMEEAQTFIDKAAKEDREAFEEYLLDMFYEEAEEAAQEYVFTDYVEGYGPNKYKVKIEEDEEEIANLTEAITTKQEIDGVFVDINDYDIDFRRDKITAYMNMWVSDDQEVWLRFEYNNVLENAEFGWEADGPATYVPQGEQRVLFDDGKGSVEWVDVGELEPDKEVYEALDETVLSKEDVLNILKIDEEQLTKLEKAARKIASRYLKPIIEEHVKDDPDFWPDKDDYDPRDDYDPFN